MTTPQPDERVALDDLAVQLNAMAVWARELALAAETPRVPVELGDNVSERLEAIGQELARLGEDVARVDVIVSEWQPLRPFLHGGEPWGARAHGSDRDKWGKRLSTVLSLRQILWLASEDLPWRDEQPGIAYLDGLQGLPGLEEWVSPRAARRQAAERLHAIQLQALQEECTSCGSGPGKQCVTRTGRYAETYHRPRIALATATVDAPADGDT